MTIQKRNSQEQLRINLERLRQRKMFAAASYDELTSTEKERMVSGTPRDMPRTRDKVKGKVRLRWDHRISTNISSYRIDKVAERSLKVYEVDPDPVTLSVEVLRLKHHRI